MEAAGGGVSGGASIRGGGRIERVRVIDAAGGVGEAEIVVTTAAPCTMSFSSPVLTIGEFATASLFDGLVEVRRQMEAVDSKLLIVGARRDAVVSGMSRSMSGGRKAYLVRLGEPADLATLTDIFAPAEPAMIGTIAEQRRFRERWLRSLAIGPDVID